jgi:hypothetical protein
VWIGAARKGPATSAKKRKEIESEKANETLEISANDEVGDREGNKENESAKANKVSSSDEVQARAGDKQTSKAVRRRSFENLGGFEIVNHEYLAKPVPKNQAVDKQPARHRSFVVAAWRLLTV